MFNYNQTEIRNHPVPPVQNIEALIKSNLPPLPGNAFRVLELLRDVNVTTNSLATAVGYDPLLTARLLRLANSSYYSAQRNISTIQKAIDTIGTKALYDAVMLGVAANTFSREIQKSKIGHAIWEHSLAVALLTKEITQMLGMHGTENAFICGLLHDIGKFILLRADPVIFTELSEMIGENEMIAAEEKYFGVNHAEVGLLLTRRWGLPGEISSAILYHHEPAKTSKAVVVTHTINAADLIVSAHGYGLSSEDETDYLQSDSIDFLRLTQKQMKEAWESVQGNLREIAGNLKIH